MKKEVIENVLDSLMGSIEDKNIELYKSLLKEEGFEKYETAEDFYFGLIYPHGNFLDGLIKSTISKDKDVAFILKHSQYIECHFEKIIINIEGSSCCADKSRTIMARLLDFFKNGNRIDFDYTQQYTYHLPKSIFNTHNSIIEFYTGLKFLYYGNPEKYLIAYQNVIKHIGELNRVNK